MRIFLQNTSISKHQIADILSDKNANAYEKIGAIFAQGISLLSEKEPVRSEGFASFFSSIGIDPNDRGAIKTMQSLFSECANEDLVMVRTPDTGVFRIGKKIDNGQNFKNIAVFKIGAKRAAIEILVRRFAWLLGLERQMVPSMYCAASDPDIRYGKNEEETLEELWNGNVKRFVHSLLPDRSSSCSSVEEDSLEEDDILHAFNPFSESKTIENGFPKMGRTTSAVVGVVQPFLHPEESKEDLLEFVLMSILACAIGLRDGKKDGYIHNTWFDVEDCMPTRIDPDISKEGMEMTASAFDLPYLDKDERADLKLPLDKIDSIAQMVKNWDIAEILKTLSEQRILFYDQAAENMKVKQRGFDSGNCLVKIEEPKSHAINGHLKIDLTRNSTILTPMQLDACGKRLERLKRYILKCSSEERRFSAKDLFLAVDKHLNAYYKSVMSLKISKSDLFRKFDRHGVFSLMGRMAPFKIGVKISTKKQSEDLSKVSQALHELKLDFPLKKGESSCRDTYRLSPSNSDSFFQKDEETEIFL